MERCCPSNLEGGSLSEQPWRKKQEVLAPVTPEVDAESNLGALRSGLRGNPFNKIAAVEGVNHMFQHCQTGMTTEYRDIEETFAPEVLEMLVKWLSKLKY